MDEEGDEMQKSERARLRESLDRQQRHIRVGRERLGYKESWLREVRQALGIPATALAKKLDCNRSAVHGLERRESKKTLSLGLLEKTAEAMGCMLVYTIIPMFGYTLEELAEERKVDARRARVAVQESGVEEGEGERDGVESLCEAVREEIGEGEWLRRNI